MPSLPEDSSLKLNQFCKKHRSRCKHMRNSRKTYLLYAKFPQNNIQRIGKNGDLKM